MRLSRVHDTRTQGYEVPFRNVHVSALGREPQTAANNLDTDRAFYMVRGKHSVFSQSHHCNPQWSLLDQRLGRSPGLGVFGKFSQSVVFCSQHECKPFSGKPTNSKNRRFFAPWRLSLRLLHKTSSIISTVLPIF